jgi:hypothetical protein
MNNRRLRRLLFMSLSVMFFVSLTLVSPIKASAKTSSNKTYDGKLIIVGDSRTRNMSRWVRTSSVETRFVAESGKGYEWFISEGIDEVSEIAEAGDTVLVWLGVNDYNNISLYNKYGKTPWELYTEIINQLSVNEWANLKVCVAGVGYVDRSRLITYYGVDSRSNVADIDENLPISGIQGFNTYLKENLYTNISWLNPANIIGIASNDEPTRVNVWLKRSNGLYDGLHYNKATTQKIYDYFAKQIIALNSK